MKKCLLISYIVISNITFAQTPEILWSFDMNDMAFGQAAAADVNGNGFLDVCFSTYRNDGLLYMLEGDGSIIWTYDIGGCGDAAPVIYDVDMDGDLEVILAGSCNPTTFCIDADSGFVQWQTPMRGSDSPPVIGDVDNDGKPEIIHGQFGGYVLCLNGEDGSVVWELEVDPDSWIQTEPALLDANGDGQLDFVIATWSFGVNHKLFCYNGNDASLIWQSDAPEDVIYHGVSFGDMDNDGIVELVIGDYAGILHCFNATNGELNWEYQFPSNSYYIGAPTSMADLNNDGFLEVVFNDWFQIGAVDHNGELLWSYNIPDYGQAFRGIALADINGDAYPDLTFCSSEGKIISLRGENGAFIKNIDLKADFGDDDFELEFAPLIADFNNDGILDAFVAGGHAEYPDVENNFGRVYMVTWGEGNGPEWKMFRRDYHRSACICNDSLLNPQEPVAILNIRPTDMYQLYPNPAYDQLHIEINGNVQKTIILVDVMGRTIKTYSIYENNFDLDISMLPAGIYSIEILQGNDSATQLFVKE
ncbi:MAG: FG-GAP-like repeat-containing protein [Chitinophagales bacterium]|nr:VCBS repeat-containing protein [Bacteroidota bacterium]